MKTREYAVELRKIADFLDSRPEFEIGHFFFSPKTTYSKFYAHASYDDKQVFVAAVKALGDYTKKYTGNTDYSKLEVTAKAYPLELSIPRDKVCKKIVTFDCEPLFSESEIEAL